MSPTAVPSAWRYAPRKETTGQGAQVDLLFDRDDGSLTICEIKYMQQPYYIDKQEAAKLGQKITVFREKTRTQKQVFLSVISASGLKESMYSEEMVDGLVVLDDLFRESGHF